MSPTYWHGGPSGLTTGDRLVPRNTLTTLPPALAGHSQFALALHDHLAEHDPTYVYITTDRELAGQFAGVHAAHPAGGTLYQVQPEGPMQPDPDLPDVGMRCSSALILSGTSATAWQYPHADKRYTTWEDPSFPMYSPDGHALPSPMGASLGVTAEDLRPLGLWPEHRDILERMQAVVLRIRPGLTPQDLLRISRRFAR